MIVALAFTLCTGISFALISMVVSSLAREKLSFFQFYAVSNLAAAVIAWLLLPKWPLLTQVCWHGVWIVALAVGIINCISQAGMVLSLRYGHNGMSVAIRNSAAVVSMIFGVIFLHEKVSPINLTGVAFVIVSLAVIAILGRKNQGSGDLKRWFPAVTLSFLMSGSYQIMMTAFTLLPETTRSAGVRIPCLFCCCALANGIAALIERKFRDTGKLFRFSRKQLKVMLLWVGAAFLQYYLLLLALDAMRKAAMAALTWPLLIGINVTVFSFFCRLKWREKYPLSTVLGMAGCIIGLILIIWGRK